MENHFYIKQKNKYLYFFFFLIMVFRLSGQTIQHYEYVIDTNPDLTSPTVLSPTVGLPDTTDIFNIPVSNLSSGFHTIYIRSVDILGNKSIYQNKIFYVNETDAQSSLNIQQIEYVIDVDPDTSSPNIFTPNSNSGSILQNISLTLGGLSTGFHKIYLRTVDNLGNKSIYVERVFYVFDSSNILSPLDNAEFIFNDELTGISGVPIPLNPVNGIGDSGPGVTLSENTENQYLLEIPASMTNCGLNNVTFRVKNQQGVYSHYAFELDINIFDNAPPTIVPYDNITVVLDENGEGSLVIDEVDNATFDDCTLVSVELPQPQMNYTCADLGANTVTVTAIDAENKVSTLDVPFTVIDNIDPVAVANTFTVQLDANGQASVNAADLDGGSTDNCGIEAFSLDISTFDCSNLGDNAVVFTVTDASGNSNSTNATISVVENEPPVVVTQDITVQLDANGQASISASDIDNGSSDNCGIASSAIDISTFDCSNLGNNTVTLTVQDAEGNESSATAVVTVEDDTNPIAVTQDITVELDVNGQATISASDVDNGSGDNCSVASLSLDITSFDCSDLGDNTVTLTVQDADGNESSSTAVVTVVDNLDPVAIAQDISVSLDANGQASISDADIDNGSSDNCGIVSAVLDVSTFDCSNLGDNTVTLTVTDASGNSSSATAVVTVEDVSDPIAVTQDITVQLDASGQATISASDVDNGSSDNCGIVSSTLDINSFDCSDLVTNSVTLTVTDASGNSSSATAVVTVVDDVDPIAIAQDFTVSLDANGQASIDVSDIDNGSSDNCGIVSSSLDISTFDCSDVGTNLVTLTLTDASGNSSSATAVVTVEDNNSVVAVAQDITVQLDANGIASITAADIDLSTDNCSIAGAVIDISTFDCSNIGDNVVTLTVTDASGNSDSTTATVTVEDNESPVAIAQNISVQLDANGLATITASDIDNGSTDNCSIVSTSIDISSFDCTNVAANTVTLTVTDASGNTDTATAIVTVVEDIDPIVVAQDIVVELDANGVATISAGSLDNGSSDNCGITNIYLDVNSFDCDDLGDNTVNFTVEDGSGNTNSTSVIVTVEDNLDPTAIGQDITVDLAGNPSVSITAADLDNGSFDNCGNVTLSVDVDTFTAIGVYPVVLTVEDQSGNTTSVTVTVTVEDTLSIIDNEIQKIDIKIYPVPTRDILFFETKGIIKSYRITDLNGKILLEQSNSHDQVYIDQLSDGVYFIHFYLANGQKIVKRFIIG